MGIYFYRGFSFVFLLVSVASFVLALFTRGPAVIAGLEFNAEGRIFLYSLLLVVAISLFTTAFTPLLVHLYNRWFRPKSYRLQDMYRDIRRVHRELLRERQSWVSPRMNAELTVLKSKLEALRIPTPVLPIDIPDRWDVCHGAWLYFLPELIVYARERRYKDAKRIHHNMTSVYDALL